MLVISGHTCGSVSLRVILTCLRSVAEAQRRTEPAVQRSRPRGARGPLWSISSNKASLCHRVRSVWLSFAATTSKDACTMTFLRSNSHRPPPGR